MAGKWVHGFWVTSSPSSATAISSVICSSIPATLSLFFKFPGSLASIKRIKVELHEQSAVLLQLGSAKTLSS